MVPLPPGTSRAMSQLTFFTADVRICSISSTFNWDISILCRGKLRSDQLAKLTSSRVPKQRGSYTANVKFAIVNTVEMRRVHEWTGSAWSMRAASRGRELVR